MTERVLVMERVHGVKVERDHGLPEERARELAATFFRAYIRQVTVKGLYHADPHRGNVFLTPDGRLALLDFGLIGRLDDDTRTSLALLLLAVAQNRADDVADLIVSLSQTTTSSRTRRVSCKTSGASCRATSGARSPASEPERASPTYSASRCSTGSGCRPRSRSSARRSRRPRASRARSTRSSTPSR